MSELARLEALLADALVAADPVETLRRGAETLSPGLREACAMVRPDGLLLTARLVARLRFERLVQGSREARPAFESDPRAFTGLFRAYHRAVPPTAHDPRGEAALFEAWLRRAAPNLMREGSAARGADVPKTT